MGVVESMEQVTGKVEKGKDYIVEIVLKRA